MIPGSPPPNARDLIAGLGELGYPTGMQLDLLLQDVDWLWVPAGQRLFSMGDPGDGMYALFEGRVRFVVENDRGAHITWELDAPGVFGEGALLTGQGRSRTAVVVRDALLARLPPARFEELAETAPGVALAVARRVAHRTILPHELNDVDQLTTRISLISPSLPAERLEGLVDALTHDRATVVVRGDSYDGTALAQRLAAGTQDDVLVVLGSQHRHLIEMAVRQSDRVYIVVDPRVFEDLRPIEDFVRHGIDPLASPTVELILLHPRGTTLALGTSQWLGNDHFLNHHHVRDGHQRDLQRLARHVHGHAVGLVLGGGGAKGLAHLGVIRAMNELGIPIDSIGGSSMGAIIGGQCAFGATWDEISERAADRWSNWRLRLDLTVPTVSMFSGRRTRLVFEDTFGTSDIEDTWLPFFCTTVNLSTFSLMIHRRGPAAQWIRASASAPGMWPPVVDESGQLHIDGGQLNNVPTDVMREQHRGPVIAVDVFSRQSAMALSPGAEPPVGLRHLWRRRSREHFPGLADTLSRVALLGSLQHQTSARQYADAYVTPDLTSISFSKFDKVSEAVDIGYREALEILGPRADEFKSPP